MENLKSAGVVVFIVASVLLIFFCVVNFSPAVENGIDSAMNALDNILYSDDYVSAQTATRDNTQLIARAVNGEARGEPYIGQVAVGAVILNRVKHPSFPKSIAGVIYQPGAFTAVSDGQINVPVSPTSTVVKASRDAVNGWDPTDGAIYYFNPATATSKWIWSRPLVKVIGKHRFAR